MTITNKDLKRRIIELSHKHNLSHLGSCLTAVDLIEEAYQTKKEEETFILSQGHAGLALYVVLEKHYGIDADMLYQKHGVHPNRDPENKISCSSGSLGQALPVALGMALADRSKDVYCMISDGECAEGSIWEALRIKNDRALSNLRVWVNCNGFSAYDEVWTTRLEQRIHEFSLDVHIFRTTRAGEYELPFLKKTDAHYLTMTEEQYQEAMRLYA